MTRPPFMFTLSASPHPNTSFAPPNLSFPRRRESPALVPSLSISHPSVLALPTQPFALRFPSGRTAHSTGLAYSSSPPKTLSPHPSASCPPPSTSFPRRRESRAHVPSRSNSHPSVLTAPNPAIRPSISLRTYGASDRPSPIRPRRPKRHSRTPIRHSRTPARHSSAGGNLAPTPVISKHQKHCIA